jgi:hypothetical protein
VLAEELYEGYWKKVKMWKLVSQWHFQLRENSEQRFCTKCILDNFDEAVLSRRFTNFYIIEKSNKL